MSCPNFLIVGAMKGGTSSLFQWLCYHPEVAPPEMKDGEYIKETGWFTVEAMLNRYDGYCWLWRNANGKMCGEASSDYFHTYGVPEKIYRVNPEMKIIILLRNPIDRAWAHYWHEVNYNKEEDMSFEKAIQRRIIDWFDIYHYCYLEIGHYAQHLERWYKIFPSKNIAVLFSEEVWKESEFWYDQIQKFLGFKNVYKLSKANVFNKGTYTQEMSVKTREQLREYYRHHNLILSQVLNKEITWN